MRHSIFWRPDYQRHANGGRVIAEIVIAAEQPDVVANFFRRFQGAEHVTPEGEGYVVAMTRGMVTIAKPKALSVRYDRPITAPSPRLVGLRIETGEGPRKLVEIAGALIELGAPNGA